MLSLFVTIWLLHVAGLLTPGANVLVVTHLAAGGHRRGATYAALGITIGEGIWCSAAVLGVSTLFAAFPTARLFFQAAGAVYLLYIAYGIWQSSVPATAKVGALPAGRALRAGLLTNLSNPKSALFFGSVFSAALPSQPSATMLIAAVALVVLNALIWHLLLAFVFSRKAVQAGYAAQRGVFARLAGAVVGVLGLSLLVASLREARA